MIVNIGKSTICFWYHVVFRNRRNGQRCPAFPVRLPALFCLGIVETYQRCWAGEPSRSKAHLQRKSEMSFRAPL